MAQRERSRQRGERAPLKGGRAQARGNRQPGGIAAPSPRKEDVPFHDPYDYGWASERVQHREREPRHRGFGGETGHDTSWSGPSSAAYDRYAPRGPYAGRGPKGYQRSDSRIREDVCDRLTDAPDIDASNIEVAVNNGEITLAGSVRNRDEKRRSEDVIETVTGVRDVHNNLRIGRTE
jgi:hypothetical protein